MKMLLCKILCVLMILVALLSLRECKKHREKNYAKRFMDRYNDERKECYDKHKNEKPAYQVRMKTLCHMSNGHLFVIITFPAHNLSTHSVESFVLISYF